MSNQTLSQQPEASGDADKI